MRRCARKRSNRPPLDATAASYLLYGELRSWRPSGNRYPSDDRVKLNFIIDQSFMLLSAGTRLSPYEILAPIGAGGTGEVYRARNTRLDRFDREARAVAAFNHPHICQLYDVALQTHVGDPAPSNPQDQHPSFGFGNSIDNAVLVPIEANPIQVRMAAQRNGAGGKWVFGKIHDTLNTLFPNTVVELVKLA
jgi:hypothetical protein